MLDVFADDLMWLGLYEAVRATCFGISISIPTFYAIIKMYCLASGTFFTLVSELRMALHEIWKVLNLSMGSIPYGEYFSYTEELAQLEKKEPALYKTYRELMCHFYICLELHSGREATISMKTWVDYLFPSLDGPIESLQTLVEDKQITKAIKASNHEDVILEEGDGDYE